MAACVSNPRVMFPFGALPPGRHHLRPSLLPRQVFRSPRDVGEAVQDAISLLQVPRSGLGITASSKGLVAGRLVIHNQRSGGCCASGRSCA